MGCGKGGWGPPRGPVLDSGEGLSPSLASRALCPGHRRRRRGEGPSRRIPGSSLPTPVWCQAPFTGTCPPPSMPFLRPLPTQRWGQAQAGDQGTGLQSSPGDGDAWHRLMQPPHAAGLPPRGTEQATFPRPRAGFSYRFVRAAMAGRLWSLAAAPCGCSADTHCPLPSRALPAPASVHTVALGPWC